MSAIENKSGGVMIADIKAREKIVILKCLIKKVELMILE